MPEPPANTIPFMLKQVLSCTIGCTLAISKLAAFGLHNSSYYFFVVLAGSIELQTYVPPVLPENLIV